MASTSTRLEGIEMPARHRAYYEGLLAETMRAFERARAAKAAGADASPEIETQLAFDLSDRVAKMHEIDIAEPLRKMIAREGKEKAALVMSREIALGRHSDEGVPVKERAELAVRVGLAIVTEGVTVAPLQGIADVTIKKNRDGSEYLSVSIAGPMRSAGGTESAVTMLIADHVRRAVGLSAYRANDFDDETGRFVEELRLYEREASNFQYRVSDSDIAKTIGSLPVELDGVDTDPVEVTNHKGMKRIRTDRVRGGALRVLNDGLIGRSKKLLKRVEKYGIDGWEWLGSLEGAIQAADEDAGSAATKRIHEVIMGRSFLSKPNTLGGFRLRYGRACNTGFTSVGIHPAVAEILDHAVAVGTQVKTDAPGKGATIAFVDSIEGPVVRLKNGDVVRVRDADHGISLKPEIEEILHLGDMLVSFGDFVENNAELPPTGYVDEYWDAELRHRHAGNADALSLAGRRPSLADALEASRSLGMPLHPAHLHYWDQIDNAELDLLLRPEERGGGAVTYPASCKRALEKLGAEHRNRGGLCVLEGETAGAFEALLFSARVEVAASRRPYESVSAASGIDVRPKFSTSVGVRVGRPEKAAARNMSPPVHVLFPSGKAGGAMRDILKAADSEFYATISNRECPACRRAVLSAACPECGAATSVMRTCGTCRSAVDGGACPRCGPGARISGHRHRAFPIKDEMARAQARTRVRARTPFKGVRALVGQDRAAEPLEKGLLRQERGLTVFRDGTVRYEATNATLTHFRPSWIGTPVETLRRLGYETDAAGAPLERDDQTVELLTQDVIIPRSAAQHLVAACKFVDAELERLYGAEPFYSISEPADLAGHVVVGLAPHTSVGIVTRVIGFTDTHVCFGTPNWHSAKRRDADGDADSFMMLMDVLLNFSRAFLSDRIGGIMDAPLLVQPYVIPHEGQPQAHNLEVVGSLPLEFFEATLTRPKAASVTCVEMARSRLGTPAEYAGYAFTHETSSLTTSKARSAYSTAGSMHEKLVMQLRNADLINAVDTADVVSDVVTTHLVPDIAGNLRAYARQNFTCTACNEAYRRVPLSGLCKCGNRASPTITRASVEKYLEMARRLVDKYDVGEYHRGRIHHMANEVVMVFGAGSGSQTHLGDYA